MKDIAGRCTHMGPVGAGLAAKMINQLIVGVGHAMLGEAVGLCEKAGIDAARIPECLAGGYRRQQRDEGLLAAHGAARLRAARLRAPAIEGPGDGERVGEKPALQDTRDG
jgi:3-hydroxyisobutyrate dehydrogenase-like beta-hydroxyacid dehydrogenase